MLNINEMRSNALKAHKDIMSRIDKRIEKASWDGKFSMEIELFMIGDISDEAVCEVLNSYRANGFSVTVITQENDDDDAIVKFSWGYSL